MKNRILNIIVLLSMAVLYTSCDKVDGAHYDGEGNKVSFLTPENLSIVIDSELGYLEVPLGRTPGIGELTTPVNISSEEEGYTEIFTVNKNPVFENDVNKTFVKVDFGDLSSIDPAKFSVSSSGMDVNVGMGFPFTLTIPDEDLISAAGRRIVNVNANNLLEFEDFGTATLNSDEGFMEETYEIQVQKAVGLEVYKLIEPFGFNNIAFMIESDGKTVVFPDQTMYDTGADVYGPVQMQGVVGEVDEGGNIILNVGSYQVEAGSFGPGVEIITFIE